MVAHICSTETSGKAWPACTTKEASSSKSGAPSSIIQCVFVCVCVCLCVCVWCCGRLACLHIASNGMLASNGRQAWKAYWQGRQRCDPGCDCPGVAWLSWLHRLQGTKRHGAPRCTMCHLWVFWPLRSSSPCTLEFIFTHLSAFCKRPLLLWISSSCQLARSWYHVISTLISL